MKKILFTCFSLFLVSLCSIIYVPQVSAFDDATVTSIDTLYAKISESITQRTTTIWFKKIKTKIEEKLRSTLLSGIEKQIKMLDGEQKIVFQSLWSKITQRKDIVQFSTHDLATQRELIGMINTLRKENGLNDLIYNPLLAKAAYNHANDMYLHFPYDTDGDGTKEIISHMGTDGSKVNTRVEVLGYSFSFVAENIAYNQTTVSQVITDRKNSPTHYQNIISDKATQIGVTKLGSYRVMVIGTNRKNN